MMMTAILLAAALLLPQEETRESFEVWLCPLHRDEQAVGPGVCPICERSMVQRLLTSSYSCPMHPHIDREEPGTCNICYMDLVAMTRELQWYCPDDPRVVSYVPGGVCSKSGEPMVLRTNPMAHGDQIRATAGSCSWLPIVTITSKELSHRKVSFACTSTTTSPSQSMPRTSLLASVSRR